MNREMWTKGRYANNLFLFPSLVELRVHLEPWTGFPPFRRCTVAALSKYWSRGSKTKGFIKFQNLWVDRVSRYNADPVSGFSIACVFKIIIGPRFDIRFIQYLRFYILLYEPINFDAIYWARCLQDCKLTFLVNTENKGDQDQVRILIEIYT